MSRSARRIACPADRGADTAAQVATPGRDYRPGEALARTHCAPKNAVILGFQGGGGEVRGVRNSLLIFFEKILLTQKRF